MARPAEPVAAEAVDPEATAAAEEAARWGRVEDDGTVHVRAADGSERVVGQYAAGSPEEALRFYVRRFEALAGEITLLERRVESGAMSPEEARTSIATVRTQVDGAAAVGDLASLEARLDGLGPVLEKQREARREEKAKRLESAKATKEKLVTRAEKVAAGKDWRGGANLLRDILTEWKALARLDRASDDELWKRFSAARTTYTRARKAHFSELDDQRAESRVAKERLIKEAEALSSSTEWGPTSGKYRDLMTRWKTAGVGSKSEDDELWRRFRTAQDVFFSARDAANQAEEEEYTANAEVKDAILVEAEALLPIKDLGATKRAWRDLADRWESAGKVPRARVKEMEARIRKVEQAIRSAEDAQWSRSDPEKSARADDMVSKLERAVADLQTQLEAARAAGDDRRASRLESDLAGRQGFLDMARRTAAELG